MHDTQIIADRITSLSERSREILRAVVDAFVATGAPIGSHTLSQQLGMKLSPATIRNTMADLEDLGLLASPHTSAGRMPTEQGLRLYVHGLLERGNLSQEEQDQIRDHCGTAGRSIGEVMEEASLLLSNLSNCAGLVFAPKQEEALRHIEFVALGPGRALVVMVSETGQVENRLIDTPLGLPLSSLIEAGNYLTRRLRGRTLNEIQTFIQEELKTERAELDRLTKRLVQTGLALWSQPPEADSQDLGTLVVRGQAQLLGDVDAIDDLERVRHLFSALERKETLLKMLELTNRGEGVQIFIGAENELFGLSGCSLVMAPYTNQQQKLVGAVAVIGPTRIDYARIIPMVDYTAKVMGHLLG